MSRPMLRSVLELRAPMARLMRPTPTTTITTAKTTPATAIRFFNQTTQHVDPVIHPEPTLPGAAVAATTTTTPTATSTTTLTTTNTPFNPILQTPSPLRSPRTQPPTPPTTPTPLSPSVRALLPALAAQPGHYITVLIHGKRYLVTQGDTIRLPFLMPGVSPGDVLRLNRASELGSRDLTLQGAPYVDERLFACRATVVGTEAEPMRVMVKKKRRCRRMKRVFSKHRYTVLRVSELSVRREVEDL
ncbi:ribosomal protein L21-like protein [Dichotomopilus funicola]|uniref:Large ribosomal subunit protein bL21m n=1 Tax=Dichotomopilus funicola TaxID=1934379 RepID=A0AAN6ZKS8_9PEZI|nr:ribosomal protein L21-like protein [Dichotomopilus funicola]